MTLPQGSIEPPIASSTLYSRQDYTVHEAQVLNSIIKDKIKSAELDADSPYISETKRKLKPIVISVSQKRLDKIRYWIFKLPNYFRLFAVMLDRVLSFSKRDFLPAKFGLFGIVLYGTEFVFCLGRIAYATFFPDERIKNTTTKWSRFKNIIQKEDMLSDLVNAGVWFGLNLASYILTAGVLPLAITMAGLIFDCIHMSGAAAYNIYSSWSEKKAQKKELEQKRKANDVQATKDLEVIFPALKEKVTSVTQGWVYTVAMTGLGAIGFGMSCFPPLAPVGAVIVFVACCLLTGLGKHLFDTGYQYFSKHFSKPKIVDHPNEQNKNSRNDLKSTADINESLKNTAEHNDSVVDKKTIKVPKPCKIYRTYGLIRWKKDARKHSLFHLTNKSNVKSKSRFVRKEQTELIKPQMSEATIRSYNH